MSEGHFEQGRWIGDPNPLDPVFVVGFAGEDLKPGVLLTYRDGMFYACDPERLTYVKE